MGGTGPPGREVSVPASNHPGFWFLSPKLGSWYRHSSFNPPSSLVRGCSGLIPIVQMQKLRLEVRD